MISEAVFLTLFACLLVWQLIGTFTEKRTGIEPLTRIMRDRLFKRFKVVKVATLLFLIWLTIHWFLPGW